MGRRSLGVYTCGLIAGDRLHELHATRAMKISAMVGGWIAKRSAGSAQSKKASCMCVTQVDVKND